MYGGSNKKENIVKLTAKEHWIIHLLLIEIYPKNNHLKLAIKMMMCKSDNQERNIIKNGKQFERLRILVATAHSKLLKGRPREKFTDEHKKNISISKKGVPSSKKGVKVSEETRLRIGLSSIGRNSGDKNPMRRPEFREKMRTNNPMKNIDFTDEKNPNAKKVMLVKTNKIYNTIKSCWEDLKISHRIFYKMVKKGEIIHVK